MTSCGVSSSNATVFGCFHCGLRAMTAGLRFARRGDADRLRDREQDRVEGRHVRSRVAPLPRNVLPRDEQLAAVRSCCFLQPLEPIGMDAELARDVADSEHG